MLCYISIKLPKLALEIRLRGIGFVVWDVSAVVHGGPKETVGTDYIKQSANQLAGAHLGTDRAVRSPPQSAQ